MEQNLALRRTRRRRGVVLVSTLLMTAIAASLVACVASYAVTHLSRATEESRFEAALAAAEAGINYQLRALRNGGGAGTASNPLTGALGSGPWRGSFRVTCTRPDGQPLDDPSQPPSRILITAVGTVGAISRALRVEAMKGGGAYDYGVFSRVTGTINGNQTIEGSVGTAGTVTVNGSNTITDRTIGLHGSTASATINPPGSFTTERRAEIDWPTVAEVAQGLVPGGLTVLSSVNDNALASAFVNSGILNGSIHNNRAVQPAIVNRSISANGTGTLTFRGKPGGAHYVLNAMTFNGNWNVVFDNSSGPISIWCVAPGSGTASFTLNGGNSSVRMSEDPSKAVRVYVSDRCNLTLNGNGVGRFGVYAINDSTNGGRVTLNGNNDLHGSVICNTYTFNGRNAIRYTAGYFDSGGGDWSLVGGWVEAHPR
ncbi:MAG TPA: hypothetical protein VLH79_01045 [Chthonomonadales bacterium]|nr:hypothetical protein [Chthonomonadales bacterium]